MLLVSCVSAGRSDHRTPSSIHAELAAILADDQKDREDWLNLSPDGWKGLTERDRQRRGRVRQILDQGLLSDREDYFNAALVLQHGEEPADFLMAHVLATIAGFKGLEDGKWLSAATLDRFLHKIDRPQLFGTDYQSRDHGPWTQEPYDTSVPDSVRAEYNAHSRQEQADKLEELNGGPP
jgi:hypothetical protein